MQCLAHHQVIGLAFGMPLQVLGVLDELCGTARKINEVIPPLLDGD